MQKYFYKMDSSLPNKAPGNIISNRSQVGFFADQRYFLGKANKVRALNLSSIFERVIFSDRVQNEMKTSLEGCDTKMADERYRNLMTDSMDYLKNIGSRIDVKTVKSFFLIFHN
jgi:hypothetical protein